MAISVVGPIILFVGYVFLTHGNFGLTTRDDIPLWVVAYALSAIAWLIGSFSGVFITATVKKSS